MAATPHPTNGIADRISELERRALPAAMVWTPLQSASGNWEAAGPDWEIIEASPVAFAERLAGKLAEIERARDTADGR